MLRDQLAARLAAMGAAPDYERLALEVLGIKGARGELARRLVSQALLIEDRRDAWRQVGEQACRDAPPTPGVYVFKDAESRALYVGKAVNLRRRLRAHFAARHWRALKPAMARAAAVEWQQVGSEIEALLREAALIEDLRPAVNVQSGEPEPRARRIPRRLLRDVILLVPSLDTDAAELVAARPTGRSLLLRLPRGDADLTAQTERVWEFFQAPYSNERPTDERRLAPLVFSWLAGRGQNTTRLDPHDTGSPQELASRLGALLRDPELFGGRIDLISRPR